MQCVTRDADALPAPLRPCIPALLQAEKALERIKAEGLIEKPFVPKKRSFTFPPVEKMGQRCVCACTRWQHAPHAPFLVEESGSPWQLTPCRRPAGSQSYSP